MERFEECLRIYGRITILVAAYPGAETQERRNFQWIIWIVSTQELFQIGIEFGYSIIENFVEVINAHPDFIKRMQAYTTYYIGAPQEGNGTLQLMLPGSILALGHLSLEVMCFQQFVHLARFRNQRAARCFSRMCSKYEFDRKLIEKLLNVRCVQTF